MNAAIIMAASKTKQWVLPKFQSPSYLKPTLSINVFQQFMIRRGYNTKQTLFMAANTYVALVLMPDGMLWSVPTYDVMDKIICC